MGKARAHVIISGRVQGVFFRYETRNEALHRNLKGWVKNRPDGKVEAVFEGEEEDVREMIEWCRKGPPMARVTDVRVEWEEYRGEYDVFYISYS
jgi:acylphosphatase